MDARDIILDGAAKLFKQKGLKSVTMDELAKSLGMSKRTIYENFKDKDELIETCLLKFSTDGLARRSNILDTNSNVYEVMYQFALLQHDETNGVSPVFFDDLHRYYSAMLTELKHKSEDISLKLLKRLFTTGIEGRYFRDDTNIEVASLLLDRLFEFAIKLIDDYHIQPCEMYRSVFLPFFRGISTDEGLRELDKVNEKMCTHKKNDNTIKLL